jgi:predicted molibdopterin-dependent oxidoreductase YjgC
MNKPLLTRLALGAARAPLAFELDGQPCTGFDGDTVLTAVLAQGEVLRHTEFSASPRAGFCGMGACQDCWMTGADGTRLRACSTPLQAGMRLLTRVNR